MCGRYGIDKQINDWITQHCSHPNNMPFPVGDIHPGESAPVLIAGTQAPAAVFMTWGMKTADGQKLIINGRSKTLWEKPLFRRSIQNCRCLLPASCFYEWDREKHKVTFQGEQNSPMFLAGIYREEKDGARFVIITEPADETISPIHDRMPVRIPESLMEDWLHDPHRAEEILKERPPVSVIPNQDVQQLSLF